MQSSFSLKISTRPDHSEVPLNGLEHGNKEVGGKTRVKKSTKNILTKETNVKKSTNIHNNIGIFPTPTLQQIPPA